MLTALIGPVSNLLGKFIEDKDMKNKLAHEVATMVCAYLSVEIPELPTFDMGSLMTVLMGMLGLGGLRSFEKYKGLTK